MEKIICDVCGTSYPETSLQCPICGCARPETGKTVTEGAEESAAPRYTAVKGGRFSARNVKKRIRASGSSVPKQEDDPSEPKKDGVSVAMIITVVALILCICAVIVYIYFQFFGNGTDPLETEPEGTTPIVSTTTVPPETEPSYISCTGIELDSHSVKLSEVGASWLVHVTVAPENTQDQVQFESKDPAVATVTDEGKVTAVAPGKTSIIITCGEVTAEFEVECSFPEETTVPETTVPQHKNVYISHKDVSISVNESFNLVLRDGNGEVMYVTWTANNPGAVKISGNVITGLVGGRNVTVSCTFEGVVYSCIVRVRNTQ